MRFDRILLALTVTASIAAGTVIASAQNTRSPTVLGVVELFTSQGCNSCPPADAALERFAARDDVLALGYHVDYWDYLGWRDTLGSAENSKRQYDYARALKRRGVYTPQAIINGRAHTNGGHYAEISNVLGTYDDNGKGLSVDLTVTDHGDRMHVSVADGAMPAGKVHMVLVYFKRDTEIAIERGENAGKIIRYVNSVVDVQTVGMWHGEAMTVDIPLTELAAKDADGCAVLLQEAIRGGYPGPILGAAILPRQSS
ncbi:DUF1223 domain-containing protein [Oricola sp.]|uniref:DUF1223 domain-containing protein n=1 Tax=Oricola sp. TaxID=1979950 RepID=UPI003BAA2A84